MIIREDYQNQILINCYRLIDFWNKCGYGIVYDGKLIKNPTISEFHNYYKTLSPYQFTYYRCGVCYDFVEFGSSFLSSCYINNNKYYMSTTLPDGDTHTFILIPHDNAYVYIEGAFEWLANEINGLEIFDTEEDAFQFIANALFNIEGNETVEKFNYYIWQYKDVPNYGLNALEFTEFITDSEPIYEGTSYNPNL